MTATATPTSARTRAASATAGVAAIYCRISRDREGGGLGVERQEHDCRPLCERRGYRRDRIRLYVDNDLSAYSGKPRPGYAKLLEDVRRGDVAHLVAWHTDRLHRSPRELEDFIDVIDAAGIAVETSRAGAYDLSTPAGRMVARQLGAVARYESEHKAERQRAKHAQLARDGKDSGGGTRPFGYAKRWDGRTVTAADELRRLRQQGRRPDPGTVVVEEEAEVIREAGSRILGGEGLRGVCTDLAARGVVGPLGRPLRASTLRTLLISARIGGRREYHRRSAGGRATVKLGEITNETTEWPAIITAEVSDELRALLTDPARHNGGNPRSYLLVGLARCGLCGARLKAGGRRGSSRHYVCPKSPGLAGCGRLRVVADPLEELVARALVRVVDGGALGRLLKRSSTDRAAVAELAAAKAKLADLGRRLGEGRITDEEWEAARTALVTRRDTAQRRIDATRGSTALRDVPDPLTDGTFDALPFVRRRAIAAALIHQVVVGPGVRGYPKFDERRVDVRWCDELAPPS